MKTLPIKSTGHPVRVFTALALFTVIAGLSVKAQVTGFGTSENPASGTSADNGTFTVNAGNCCTPDGYASIEGGTLTLGGGGNYDYGSAFADTAQTYGTFTSSFQFQQSPDANATAFAFVLQNDPRGVNALDVDNDGYAGNGAPIVDSYQVVFNVSNGSIGFLTNGASDTGSPLDTTTTSTGLNFTDPIAASLTYDGTTVSVSLLDSTTNATFSTTETVDLASVLGDSTAYVGFSANQDFNGLGISTFEYLPGFTDVPEPSSITYLVLSAVALIGLLFYRARAA